MQCRRIDSPFFIFDKRLTQVLLIRSNTAGTLFALKIQQVVDCEVICCEFEKEDESARKIELEKG